MSSEIEYRHLAVGCDTAKVPEAWERATGEYRFSGEGRGRVYLVLVEHGSSNTYTHKIVRGKQVEVRARNWSIGVVGSNYQVVSHATRLARFAHSGMTKLRNAGPSGWVTPEAYIRCYRSVLESAIDGDTNPRLLADHHIQFTDPQDVAGQCQWMQKAKAEGRLTYVPMPYAKDGETYGILRLHQSNDAGELACDLLAMARIFEDQGRDKYPHFSYRQGIGMVAESAWDSLERQKWLKRHASRSAA